MSLLHVLSVNSTRLHHPQRLMLSVRPVVLTSTKPRQLLSHPLHLYRSVRQPPLSVIQDLRMQIQQQRHQQMLCALVQLVPLLAVQALHLSVRHRQAAPPPNIFLDLHVLRFQRHALQVNSTRLPLLRLRIVYAVIAVLAHFLQLLRILHHLALF